MQAEFSPHASESKQITISGRDERCLPLVSSIRVLQLADFFMNSLFFLWMILDEAWYISQWHYKGQSNTIFPKQGCSVSTMWRERQMPRWYHFRKVGLGWLLRVEDACGKATPLRFMPSAVVVKPFRVLSARASVLKFNKVRTVPTPEGVSQRCSLSPLLRDSRLPFVERRRTLLPS